MPPALLSKALTLRRGAQTVLEGLEFSLPAGSLSVILGPNGAGKSTLLRLATGEFMPSSGSLRVLDQDFTSLGWRDAARLRHRIGYMPQLPEHAPAVPLSLREVVEIGRVALQPWAGSLSASDRAVCQHWLQRFGLSSLADRPYQDLSGGEQRKAQLARIFAQEPEIILLDEPAGHLDLPSQDRLVRLLSEVWRETHTTVVMVTHELRHIPRDCSHVLMLDRGHKLDFGPPDTTLSDKSLSRLYGEPVELIRHRGRYAAIGADLPSVEGGPHA
jgi:iron complex transport system ATP-binding protein